MSLNLVVVPNTTTLLLVSSASSKSITSLAIAPSRMLILQTSYITPIIRAGVQIFTPITIIIMITWVIVIVLEVVSKKVMQCTRQLTLRKIINMILKIIYALTMNNTTTVAMRANMTLSPLSHINLIIIPMAAAMGASNTLHTHLHRITSNKPSPKDALHLIF